MLDRLTAQITVDRGGMQLLRRTARALLEAELGESAEALVGLAARGRLLAATTDEVTDGGVVLALRPYAELGLWELESIARSTADPATKARRVNQVLALAGLR